MPTASTRWTLVAMLWIEAWLALPWMPRYLALPFPWGGAYVWAKVWAAILLPAFWTAGAIAPDLRHHAGERRLLAGAAIAGMGLAWQTLYLLHHVPDHALWPVIARWGAAALALVSLALSLRSPRENAPPALEILASAALILAFIAQPRWADLASLAVLAATLITLLHHRRPPRPNT